VRRLSVASLDSGAESPVYGEEPSALAGRMGPEAEPPWVSAPHYASNGGLVVSAAPAWLPPPSVAPLPALHLERTVHNESTAHQEKTGERTSSGASAQYKLPSQLPGFSAAFDNSDQAPLSRYVPPGAPVSGPDRAVSFGEITPLKAPQGGSTRDVTVTVSWIPAQASAGASRLARTYDMSVVDQQSGRWYVKDIRASTQPTGTP
jgi:hypothetical protein